MTNWPLPSISYQQLVREEIRAILNFHCNEVTGTLLGPVAYGFEQCTEDERFTVVSESMFEDQLRIRRQIGQMKRSEDIEALGGSYREFYSLYT